MREWKRAKNVHQSKYRLPVGTGESEKVMRKNMGCTMNKETMALKNYLVSSKKENPELQWEYEMIYANNKSTQNVWTGEDIRGAFPRYEMDEGSFSGYTKVGHKCRKDENGDYIEMETCVVKRFSVFGGTVDGKNQVIEEIKTWEYFAGRDESDFLSPVLRWGYVRGDKVSPLDERNKEECYIVAQKAVKVGQMKKMCEMAEKMNNDEFIFGESAEDRYHALCNFADDQGWWDVKVNGGNCGVIFDYSQNCYKAVIIDYAL